MRNWKFIFLWLFFAITVSLSAGCHRELGKGKDFNNLDPKIGTILGFDNEGHRTIKMAKRPLPIFTDQNVVKVHKEGLRPTVIGKFASGREYPVLFDSGSSYHIIVQEKHVRENNFSCYPFYYDDGKPRHAGLCLVDKLEIGTMRFEQTPCIYLPDTPIMRILGIPIGSGDFIILGLNPMKEFKYICIDDKEKNVSLSGTELFSADEGEGWRSYPMAVEPNGKNLLLFISIPVQGEVLKLRFDTGSPKGLAFSRQQWDKVSAKFKYYLLLPDSISTPDGKFKCKQSWVHNLNIADLKLSKLEFRVVEEGNTIFNKGDGFIGMEAFKNKTIVLDFARNLFWIK